ncbi:MAG TPA: MBL fold metallo-hydrolase, partial [Candidatus Dojkabacteria bacterium]
MLNTENLIVGQLQTNCYLLFDKENDCLIIDPGDDAEYISQVIGRLELTPLAIIAT